MKEGLVTIVLPIYNVEKYLNRCIESVVAQTYENLEILLVDDGATDNCPQICDNWAQKDSRIKVIHKENQGAGMARNTGIENATGEYICFFDSDDYIAEDTVEKAYNKAKINNSEMVIFGFNNVDANGNVFATFKPADNPSEFKGDEVLEKFFPDFMAPNPHHKEPKRFYMSLWVLMCSTELIKRAQWRFVSEREMFSEDVYSLLKLFKYVNSVAVLPEALYYYCDNGASLSRRYIPDRYEKIKHFLKESIKLCEKLNYSEEIKHRVTKPYLAFTIATLKQESIANRSFEENLSAIKGIVLDPDLQRILKQSKKDKVSVTRRVLYFCLRNKLFLLSYILLKAKA